MAKLARDIMTPDPACCSPSTTLDQLAKMMVQNDCGEIPIVDVANRPIGVVTDRDIVCRAVAEGKNPVAYPAENIMTKSIVTAPATATVEQVVTLMGERQIRRLPVVDDEGALIGIIAQADIAVEGAEDQAADLVREVSRDVAHRVR